MMTMTIVKIMTSLHLDVASKDDPASLELTKMKWKVEDMEIWNENMKWNAKLELDVKWPDEEWTGKSEDENWSGKWKVGVGN